MDLRGTLQEIEAEIARLETARAALLAINQEEEAPRVGNAREVTGVTGRGKRTMSAATRKKLSDLAKARWASRRRINKERSRAA